MSTKKRTATAISVSVLALLLAGLSPLPQLLAASTATTGNNNLGPAPTLIPVQVSIQTKNLSATGSYDLVAFNSTGAQVASYVGQYSQVTLQLPAGTFLLAATANGPSRASYPPCYVKGGAGVTTAAPPAQAGGNAAAQGAGSAIAYPCCCYSNPPQEYGYSLTKVSGPTAVTIATQPPSTIPSTPVTVSVSYKNGSAVSDAYVYANIVGGYLYWGDNSRLTMYAQTGANGVAHLVVPAVPLSVTASKSVPVNIPKSQTTVQVTIGGQVVNVTVYFSPTYVYETASALLLPPATSLTMVVTAQTGYPIVVPYASGASAGAPGQAAPGIGGPLPPNSVQGAPAEVQGSNAASTATTTAQLTSIPPIPASAIGVSSPGQTTSPAPTVNLLAIGTLALAGAIAATVGVAIARTKH